MRKQTKLVAALSATALLAVGASMTSFAKGWTEIGDGEYVYLDSDGERVTNEWRRSGSDYFFLDENGEIAKSKLITPNEGDTDAYYYVNSIGARLKNQWVRVMNDDHDTLNDQEPEMFWYYLGSNGKAVRNDTDGESDYKKVSIEYAGAKRTFFFDTEGRMVTGWIDYKDKNLADDKPLNRYYCDPDDPAGGYAVTSWQQLEVPDDWDSNGQEYDVIENFYFESSGKMKKAETAEKPLVWYKDGWYYSFDNNGVMISDWYTSNVAIATGSDVGNATANNSDAQAFTSASGTKQGSGWIFTDKNDDGDYKYYYLVNYVGPDKKSTRNIPFNSVGNNGKQRAKAIDGKIYLFDTDGVMKDGLVTVNADDTILVGKDGKVSGEWGGVAFRKLKAGTYLFSDGKTGVKGQMLTGRQLHTSEGENNYYYFDKNTGVARKNQVIDGYLYGDDGAMVKADDGNSSMIVTLGDKQDVTVMKGSSKDVVSETIKGGSKVIVTANGKIKTSVNGYTKIDGDQWRVTKDDKGNWDVIRKEDYEESLKK